ncbi:hypothetical protein Droror1_Dr00025342 [Drosera rotundifolia]
MAYGGGFVVSWGLAKEMERMQDLCIARYPGLYGSDERVQTCMAELGVPLTRELGFHQYDVYGNLFGLLAAHPVTPLVSLHHLDVVEPIFPNVNRVLALEKLAIPMKIDSAGLMQQSICYDRSRNWTISVSWGLVSSLADPSRIQTVIVHKAPDPHLWDRAPRRNCCRKLKARKSDRMMIEVGVCREGEVTEL